MAENAKQNNNGPANRHRHTQIHMATERRSLSHTDTHMKHTDTMSAAAHQDMVTPPTKPIDFLFLSSLHISNSYRCLQITLPLALWTCRLPSRCHCGLSDYPPVHTLDFQITLPLALRACRLRSRSHFGHADSISCRTFDLQLTLPLKLWTCRLPILLTLWIFRLSSP